MTTWNTALYDKVYKTMYPDDATPYLMENGDFLPWFTLDTEMGGSPWRILCRTNAVRGSSKFEVAVSDRNAADYDAFDIDEPAEEHVVVSISLKAAKMAAKDAHAVVKLNEQAMQASFEEFTRAAEHKLQGNGGGSIGRIASIPGAAKTITLTDASRIYNFVRKMKVEISNNDDGTTSTGGGLRLGELTVDKIDEDSNTVIFEENVSTVGGAVNDFVFRKGDFDAGVRRIVQGMFGWNPPTVPGGTDSWFTVNRSNHVGALSGVRVTGVVGNVFDILREGCMRLKRNRGKAKSAWVSPGKAQEIDQTMAAKQIFTMKTAYEGVELEGVKVTTQAGIISIHNSAVWPENEGIITNQSSWRIGSVGNLPQPSDEDGQLWHIEELKDAMQIRHKGYFQLVCDRPQDNANLNFAA